VFEDKTIVTLQNEMLSNISEDYEKSPGNLPYDLLRSFAIELSNLYIDLAAIADKIDVDKLLGEELDKYVFQRKGLNRKQPTYAVGVLTVVGNGTINIGDIFESVSGVQFTATQTIAVAGTANVSIQAVIPGGSGNLGANVITQMPITITGITSVNNAEGTYNGYEGETDASLRERYYSELQKPPSSGNIYHYLCWANEVPGVGDAKVIPLWNGNNTVKVVIIDSNKVPASAGLVNSVQVYIDPGISGNGSGAAPMGAYCTVVSATAKNINISVNITRLAGYSVAEVTASITTSITAYLASIAFKQDSVSYAQISSSILNSKGVQDLSSLLVNGGTSNVAVATGEVAVLGSVSVT